MKSEASIISAFFHRSPLRQNTPTWESVIELLTVLAPLTGIVAFVGTFLVLTIAQWFQAEIVAACQYKFGHRAQFAALLGLPMTALLTWYCYDYLTPSNVSFGGNLFEPYEHGLSVSRYIKTLLIQAPITLFGFLYFDADLRGHSSKPVLLAALVASLVAGALWGCIDGRSRVLP
jgi:hypothetical protein